LWCEIKSVVVTVEKIPAQSAGVHGANTITACAVPIQQQRVQYEYRSSVCSANTVAAHRVKLPPGILASHLPHVGLVEEPTALGQGGNLTDQGGLVRRKQLRLPASVCQLCRPRPCLLLQYLTAESCGRSGVPAGGRRGKGGPGDGSRWDWRVDVRVSGTGANRVRVRLWGSRKRRQA